MTQVQKPLSQPVAAKVLSVPEVIGQATETWLCCTVPGYALYASLFSVRGATRAEPEHRAF